MCEGSQGKLVVKEGTCNFDSGPPLLSQLGNDEQEKKAGRKKGSKIWTPQETKKFYQVLQKFGSDFQTMEAMFSGRTRNELKNKLKREEKTWKSKESGLNAWEAGDLISKEEVVVTKVAEVTEVKTKKKKRMGPRKRYKNKGFYESSSGEDSDGEEKQVKFKEQASSRVASSKKVRQGLPRMPVLIQSAPRATQEEDNKKSGSLLHLLDPWRIPATKSNLSNKVIESE